jgi:hypothetical protein
LTSQSFSPNSTDPAIAAEVVFLLRLAATIKRPSAAVLATRWARRSVRADYDLIRSSGMKSVRTAAVVGAIVLGLSLIPIPYVACPSWDVSVVDDIGHPVQRATVRLVYRNYSAEARSHEEDRTTDELGHADFPRRESSVPVLRLCYYSASAARTGVHASFGRHASAFAFGKGLYGISTSGELVTNWTGSPDHMESRIVAEPGYRLPSGLPGHRLQ